jgi:hypothetical protein
MKKLIWILTTTVILAYCFGLIGCASGQKETPTPASTSTPTPTAAPSVTATPKPIDWSSVSERINKLAMDNGLSIQKVQQYGDIVEIEGLGGCTDFANAIDNEPDFILVGKPQLVPSGNCVIWFRVLSPE